MFTVQLFPMLSSYRTIILPGTIVSINISDPSSVNTLKNAIDNKSQIFIIKEKYQSTQSKKNDKFYSTGIICDIIQMVTFPDKSVKIIVEGHSWGKISNIKKIEDSSNVEVFQYFDKNISDKNEEIAYKKIMLENMKEYCLVDKNANADLITNLENIKEINKIIVFIAQQLNLDNEKQQEIINTQCIAERIELVIQFIKNEIEIVKAENKIRNIVRDQIEKRQKNIYLNEQLQAIHKELGTDKTNSEFEKIEKKLDQIKMPKETKDSMYEYLNKLQMMNPISAEATVLLNYLHVICSLPWNKNKKIKIDLARTEKILEESHFGLNKIKERILEYLAVQKHTNNKLAGPIICLIGPPGVGKTSLGKSIADSMDREFISIPLGGVSDEAEIRGHRRTYIGAMPGRIIQKLSKLKYNNPVVVLDEIDKISSDFRGDPSSALLQVLDPEQNKKFLDNYLDVDYDLSQVMFICTANTLNMSTPLLDRMEIIRLSSYTQEEKFEIAKKHLITKNMESHNLTNKEIKISDGAIKNLIKHYTQEAGVRNLEREIAKLCRKATKKVVDTEEYNKNNKSNKKELKTIEITDKNLEEFLGVKKFLNEEASKKNEIGLATGLAWTEVGGTILFIESVAMYGNGQITLTGKLGEVMKESIQASQAYVKSQIDNLNIDKKLLEKTDLHIHIPDGATPKDGPSAGVAMITCIVSTLTKTPIIADVAMTGEINLHGNVLPVGGIKEKVLAAIRSGIKTIIIPEENKKDLHEIDDKILKKVNIKCVSKINEVLNIALEKNIKKAQKKPTKSKK